MAKAQRDTAFTWRQWLIISNVVTYARNRAIMHLRHGYGGKQLFDAFVKDEHKDTLLETFKICHINVQHQNFKYTTMLKNVEILGASANIEAKFSISLGMNSEFKFLFPKYFDKKLGKATPELEEMFKLLAAIHFEWARVHLVLYELNNRCKTPAQVKTLCPHLPALLQDHSEDYVREFGDRLAKMNDSISLPAIPLELRQHALHVGQTITKLLLTPKESEVPEDELTVELMEAKTTSKRWDGEAWTVRI